MRPAPGMAPGRAPPVVSPRALRSLTAASSAILLAGLAIAAAVSLGTGEVDAAFGTPAPIVLLALVLALVVEARGGLRNLVRVDLFMLVVLYLLTFLEFLFLDETLAGRVTPASADTAVAATLLAFAGITIGRHLVPPVRPPAPLATVTLSPGATMGLMLAAFGLGYLYMLLAVDFDVVELFRQMARPRFTQPWTRGRLGSLATLLNELALLTFLLPPLAASVLAQARRFNAAQKAATVAILLFVFYEAFAGGTRNVLLTHLATFAVTYALLTPRLTFGRLVRIGLPVACVATFGLVFMAEIRTVGLARFDVAAARTATLFVDMNLVNVAALTEVFPARADWLGLDIPYVALVRPIPRALWPGKPEGLSVPIEQALGVGSEMTLSATFVGELWMASGFLAVGLGAIVLGAAAAAWNRVGTRGRDALDLILFAAGFFPAGLAMRSILSVTPAMLPALAFAVLLWATHALPRRVRRRRPAPRPRLSGRTA